MSFMNGRSHRADNDNVINWINKNYGYMYNDKIEIELNRLLMRGKIAYISPSSYSYQILQHENMVKMDARNFVFIPPVTSTPLRQHSKITYANQGNIHIYRH